jgi:hypothetical protein
MIRPDAPAAASKTRLRRVTESGVLQRGQRSGAVCLLEHRAFYVVNSCDHRRPAQAENAACALR